MAEHAALIPSAILLLATSIWGLYWLPLREIEAAGLVGPWSVLAINLVPLVLLLPFAIRRVRFIAHARWPLLFIGLLVGAGWVLYGLGLLYTTVVRATLLFYLTPIWSTLFAMAVLRERVGPRRWTAILIALFGLMVMIGLGVTDSPLTIGDGFGLLSGIAWGAGTTFIRKHPEVSPADSFIAQLLGSVAVAACAIAFLSLPEMAVPTLGSWWDAAPLLLAVCLLAVIPSGYAIVWAAQRLSPGRVGILMMSEVVVAVISAAMLTDESMGLAELLGAALILGAGVLEVSTGNSETHS